MAEYTRAQINQMQQDAMRRVRDMQRRSRSFVQQQNNDPPPPPPIHNIPPPPESPPPPKQEKSAPSFLGDILPEMKIDEEKTLIILLLIILARNGADMKLLLALGYLLM